MKRYVPFSPLVHFIALVVRNKGIPVKKVTHAIPWIIKITILEPFRWIELLMHEKKIIKHHLNEDPVFIIGHYRSGTTYLQRLFMQCDGLGYMSIFQSALPEIMLLFERRFTPVLQRFSSFFRIKNNFHRMPFEWNFPGEDDVGHAALLNKNSAQWGMLFPEQFFFYFNKYILFDGITEKERNDWITSYRYLLKKISIANHGRQLILKSPPNTARIRLLLELFPDARFIFIHRNPFDVYASSELFWKVVLNNYALGKNKSHTIRELIELQYEKMMESYLSQKQLIPEGRIIEIPYDSLIKEPMNTMQNIFAVLELKGFRKYEKAITDFVMLENNHQKWEHTLTDEQKKFISKRWRKYFDEWNYEISIQYA